MSLKINSYEKNSLVLKDQPCTSPVMFLYRLPVRLTNENKHIVAEVKSGQWNLSNLSRLLTFVNPCMELHVWLFQIFTNLYTSKKKEKQNYKKMPEPERASSFELIFGTSHLCLGKKLKISSLRFPSIHNHANLDWPPFSLM